MSTDKIARRRLTGSVVSTKMDRTAVVQVTRRFAHPVYKKYVTRSKKYYAHDGDNICHVGDEVILEATRPMSKLKRWRVVSVSRSAPETGVAV